LGRGLPNITDSVISTIIHGTVFLLIVFAPGHILKLTPLELVLDKALAGAEFWQTVDNGLSILGPMYEGIWNSVFTLISILAFVGK